MRIVSLVPAATEWIAAFGAFGDLVGRSHACDRPETVPSLPFLTRPLLDPHTGAAAIDAPLHEAATPGRPVAAVGLDRLLALRPDLVVVPATGQVRGASGDPSPERLQAAGVAVHEFAPITFKGALDAALALARHIGRLPQAMAFIAERERALQALRQRLAVERDGSMQGEPGPVVACVGWTEPLMLAGHCVPDLVEQVGGRPLGPRAGEAPAVVDPSALREAQVLVVAPLGRSVAEAAPDVQLLSERPEWASLPAVQAGRVVLCDGQAYFHRPGPGLYRTVQLLAAAVHRQRAAVEAEPWEMQPLSAEVEA